MSVDFTNIPEYSPLSYIVDLLDECEVRPEDIQSISMDEKQATVILSRKVIDRVLS